MNAHIAVLDELANKWDSEILPMPDRSGPLAATARALAKNYNCALTSCASELRAAIALMRAPVGVVGEVVEIGDDDEGQPRILIHTTRESIKNGPPLAFRTVQVSAMQAAGGGE